VAKQDVRPERPDEENAPQLLDALWELAEKCWRKHPNDRPTASVLCDAISNLLHDTTIMPQNPVMPPLPPVSQPQSMRQPYAFGQAIPDRSTPHASRFLDATSVPRPVPESFRSYPALLHDSKTLPPTPVQSSSNPPPNLTIRGHIGGVYCAAFSPDGKYIVSGSVDKTITVWDAQTGNRVLAPLRGHTGCVSSVAFSPNGTRIASSSTDGKVRVWDGQTGDLLLGPLTGHDRSRIARKTTISWRDLPDLSLMDKISSSLELKLFDKHLIFGPAMSVAFSADGKRISSLSSDPYYGNGNIALWDAATGDFISESEDRVVRALAVGFTFNHPDNYAISPDGNWLAKRKARRWQRNDNKVVEVFDTKNNELVLTISGHTDEINCISFSADSKRIATCSTDKTIRVHALVV
jgi:WD40 repeat protein